MGGKGIGEGVVFLGFMTFVGQENQELFLAAETRGTIGHRRSTVENAMIRPCTDADFATISAIINDAAQAYCGVIPADRWHEPYMSKDELRHEIQSGVRFWGWEEGHDPRIHL